MVVFSRTKIIKGRMVDVMECLDCGKENYGKLCAECLKERVITEPLTPTHTAWYSERNNVTHPVHYTSHPSGVECLQITEHMNFCLGNVMKYVWRADLKGEVEDLKKARFYLDREIALRSKTSKAEEM